MASNKHRLTVTNNYVTDITRVFVIMLAILMPCTASAQNKGKVESKNENVVRIESGLVKGFDQEGTKAFLGIP